MAVDYSIAKNAGMKIDRLLLFPYAIVLAGRNIFFDKGELKLDALDLPSIWGGKHSV